MNKNLLVILLVGSIGTAGLSASPDTWSMREETKGKPTVKVEYSWIGGMDQRTLTLRKGDRVQTVVVDSSDSALEWKKPGLTLTRTGQGFQLRTPDGSMKSFPDKGLPWFQGLPQLARFAVGADKKVQFLVFPDSLDGQLKADDLTIFEASKTERVKISLPIGEFECWKVHVTFADFRSMFWGGDYWFRTSDGLLVRYEEVRGAPGTPVTVGLTDWIKP